VDGHQENQQYVPMQQARLPQLGWENSPILKMRICAFSLVGQSTRDVSGLFLPKSAINARYIFQSNMFSIFDLCVLGFNFYLFLNLRPFCF